MYDTTQPDFTEHEYTITHKIIIAELEKMKKVIPYSKDTQIITSHPGCLSLCDCETYNKAIDDAIQKIKDL